MDAVLLRRGMEIVELDEGLELYGSGISKNLEDIGATLGPLERAVIGGQDHWVSTKHLRQYFYWLAERQRLYIRRRDGQSPILNIKIPGKPDMPCWSLDPMFAHRVTNTYRHQDDFSQFIIEDVVRNYRPRPEPDLAYRTSGQDNRYNAAGEWIDNVEEQLFRVTLLRRFGKSETCKYFLRELGDIRWKTYTYGRYYAVIKKKLRLFPHVACFTGSYQVHPPKQYGKGTPEVIVIDDSEEEEADELEGDELESDSEMNGSERKPEVEAGVENSQDSEVKPPSVAEVKPLAVADVKPLSVAEVKPLSVADVKPPSVADVKPLSVENGEHPDIKPKAELAT
jgi:hypothetical protein